MSETKQHKCPVCQADDWHPLDSIVITCPKCAGQKMIQTTPDTKITCDLCQGHGKFNYQLRDQRHWFDANYLYDEPVGMKVCKSCGFVTYSPRWTEEQWQTRYTEDRQCVNAGLIIRANVKNEFHRKFLELETNEFNRVLDIGCSFGYVRGIFPDAKFYGIEYSENLARYAKDVNNVSIIKKTQDLPDACVDLVMLYHTLEHTNDPREKLLEAKRVLAENGRLYIAVPDYFGPLREVAGSACLDFENLYHLNHNNVFSKTSLRNLLAQCGFEIIKENDQYYGDAVLCRVNENVDKKINVELWPEIEGKLYRQRVAIEILARAHKDQNSDRAIAGIEMAISHYPAYSDAYSALMVQKNNFKDVKAMSEIFDRAVAAGCANLHLRDRFATLLANWCDAGKANNYTRQAVELFEQSLAVDPSDTEALTMLIKIHAYNYKDLKKVQPHIDMLLKVNPMAWSEIQNIIGQVKCLK
jgi:SAM-dependent methyltransferase